MYKFPKKVKSNKKLLKQYVRMILDFKTIKPIKVNEKGELINHENRRSPKSGRLRKM